MTDTCNDFKIMGSRNLRNSGTYTLSIGANMKNC